MKGKITHISGEKSFPASISEVIELLKGKLQHNHTSPKESEESLCWKNNSKPDSSKRNSVKTTKPGLSSFKNYIEKTHSKDSVQETRDHLLVSYKSIHAYLDSLKVWRAMFYVALGNAIIYPLIKDRISTKVEFSSEAFFLTTTLILLLSLLSLKITNVNLKIQRIERRLSDSKVGPLLFYAGLGFALVLTAVDVILKASTLKSPIIIALIISAIGFGSAKNALRELKTRKAPKTTSKLIESANRRLYTASVIPFVILSLFGLNAIFLGVLSGQSPSIVYSYIALEVAMLLYIKPKKGSFIAPCPACAVPTSVAAINLGICANKRCPKWQKNSDPSPSKTTPEGKNHLGHLPK